MKEISKESLMKIQITVSIRKEQPRQCMVWRLKLPILFVSPKEKVKTELIRLLQALKASQGLKYSVGPGD